MARNLRRLKREWLRQHAANERRLRKALKAVFDDEAESIAVQVRDGVVTPGLLFQPASFVDRLKAAAQPQLVRTAAVGAVLEQSLLSTAIKARRRIGKKSAGDAETVRQVLDYFELDDSTKAGISAAIAESMGADFWDETGESLRDELSDLLQDGLENGAHFDELADSIGELLGGDSARVLRIATTEITGALNGGHHAARSDLIDEGLVTGSEWLASGDSAVRPDHDEANGQVTYGDGMFEVGGERCRYPGDPRLSARQRVNCRCLTIASGVWAEAEVDEGE